jgi:hypothetical protein
MKSIDSRKAPAGRGQSLRSLLPLLGLGGLLIVTLVAGCAGGPAWSNNGDGYSGGGYENTYPNLDGSAGSYPYNNVYTSSTPDNSGYGGYHLDDNRAYAHAYAYSIEHRNPVSFELEPVPVYR